MKNEGKHVAVAEPLLDHFQLDAICKQQTGKAVPEIMKANRTKIVLRKNNFKVVC